jgi:hypothetical protein
MKQLFTILVLFGLLTVTPAFGQTQKLTGNLSVFFSSNNPPSGDSSTFAYNNHLQLNERVNWKLDAVGNWNYKSRLIDYSYDGNDNLLYYRSQVRSSTDTWINSTRNTYTFDGSGRELTYLTENWDTTAQVWVNSLRNTSTYGVDGKPLTYMQEKWSGTSWANQSSKLWEYDGNGNLLSITQKNFRVLYSYDAQNQVATKIEQNFIAGNWKNYSLQEFTYTPNSDNPASATLYYWALTYWDPYTRTSDTYDGNGVLVQTLEERWNGVAFENALLYLLSYDGSGNEVQKLTQSWDSTSWVNFVLETSTYDTHHNLIYWLSQEWEAGVWENLARQFIEFDAYSNFLGGRYEGWDGTSWILYAYGRNHYAEFVATHTPKLADFELFPNPATNVVTLHGKGFRCAMIFDSEGRPVRSQSLRGQDQETIQLGNLPTGNYFLQVVASDGKIGVKPFQIMH